MPPLNPLTRPEKEVAKLRRERLAENSIYPSAGPRLGVFSVPGPDTKVMPPAPPNLAEVDDLVSFSFFILLVFILLVQVSTFPKWLW